MFLLFIVAFFVVLFDQISKLFILKSLPLGHSMPVIDKIFYLTHVQNRGGAFGLFAQNPFLFIAVSLLTILLIIIYYSRSKERAFFFNLALGLELGGAVGNLIDRLRLGVVVDFLDFRFWPVFNLADIAIVSGVFLLLIISLGTLRRSSKSESSASV